MTDCKDCKSNDFCKTEDKPCDGKGNCFFFSETEESRIRNSMEYKQGRADAIDEMKSLIFQFDDYCDGMECSDCWMNEGDSSCLKLWIDRKFEQLKEQSNDN